MKHNKYDYHTSSSLWNKNLSYTAFIFTFILVFCVVIFFGDQLIHPLWVTISVLVVMAYFYLVNNLYHRWKEKEERRFIKQLFFMAFMARLLFMGVITIIAYFQWGQPFYLGAIDAVTYSEMAGEMALVLRGLDFQAIYPTLHSFYFQPDNWGPPFFIGIIYAIFGETPVVAKIFLNLMGAGTVLLTYKTARLIWDEHVARLSGILFALFPLALFFSSVILKEEFVVFLVMLGVYHLLLSLKNGKFRLTSILAIFAAITLLFFFRTAAGALLILTSVMAVLFYSSSGLKKVYGTVLGLSVLFVSAYAVFTFGDASFYLERLETYDDVYEARIQSVSQEQTLATVVGLPVYAVLSFVSPFPSMVYLETRFGTAHDFRYYHIPALIIWNFLVYFALVGLWKSSRKRFRESFLIIAFVVGYMLILSMTGLFTRVRFNYNAMPLMFILMAVGLQYRQYNKFWPFYLVGAVALIIAWNVFRLAGRGLM